MPRFNTLAASLDSENKLVPCTGIIDRIKPPTVKKVSDKNKSEKQKQNVVDEEKINLSSDKKDINKTKNNSDQSEDDNEVMTMGDDNNDTEYQQMEQQLEDKIDTIVMKIEEISEKNLASIKTEIKENIKQEYLILKNTLQELFETKLLKITSIISVELDIIKKAIAQVPMRNLNKDSTSTNQNSYSSVVKNKTSDTKKFNSQRIIIQHTNQQQDSAETANMIKNKVDIAKLGIGVNKIVNSDRGKVIIDVDKEADKVTLLNEIQNKLGDNVTTKSVMRKLPKLKIINVEEGILQMDEKDIIEKLSNQNDINNDSNVTNIKLIKKYSTKQGFGSILIEVSPEVHKSLLQKVKINLDWKKYRVFNFVDIVRCFKCWGFNHFKDKCTKNVTCRKCAGNHSDKECDSKELKCVNCKNSMTKNKLTDCDIHHEATNHNCQVLLRMQERKNRNVMYESE